MRDSRCPVPVSMAPQEGLAVLTETSSLLPRFADSLISVEHKSPPTGASWLSSAFIMSNIIIGIGLLNFPAAYRDAGGLTPALSVQSVCLVFFLVGSFFIVECSDLCQKDTYQEVVGHFCGRLARIVCNFFIFCHNFGTCTILLIILGDQIDGILIYVAGGHFCSWWFMRRAFTLPIASVALIFPFCFAKKIDSFALSSVVGVATTGYIIFLAAWKYTQTDATSVVLSYESRRWDDFFRVLPTVCFSFEAHIEMVPIYSCFKYRRLTEFAKATTLALSLCYVIYTLTGAFGYLTFGHDVSTDFLTSYHLDVWVIVALAITALKVVTTYPVIFYCVRLMLAEEIAKYASCPQAVCKERFRRVLVTVVLCCASLFMALLLPTMGSVISILGGSAAIYIFIFPGLCYMQAYHRKDTRTVCDTIRIGAGAVFVAVGTFLAVFAIGQSVQQFLGADIIETESPCP